MHFHNDLFMTVPPQGFYPQPMHIANKNENDLLPHLYLFHALPVGLCECSDAQADPDKQGSSVSGKTLHTTATFHTHCSPLTDYQEGDSIAGNSEATSNVYKPGNTHATTSVNSTLQPVKEDGNNGNSDDGMVQSEQVVYHRNVDVQAYRQQHALYIIGAALGRAFIDNHVFPLPLSPMIGLFLRHRMHMNGCPFTSALCLDKDNYANTTVNEMKMINNNSTNSNTNNFMHELTLEAVRLVDRDVYKSLKQLSTLDPSTLQSL